MKLNMLSRDEVLKNHLTLPKNNEIHIYLSAISDHNLVSEDKKKSRALLRRILGAYLSLSPDTLTFSTGEHGKPCLDIESTCKANNIEAIPEIHFNLSHSGDYIAFAFSSVSPVGIDIEKIRENVRTTSLVNRFFHPDEAEIFSALDEDEKSDFFFRRWTVREAFLKGLGSGLSLDPASFCVTESTDSDKKSYCITKNQKDYSSWQIDPIAAPSGYFLSVAYKRTDYMPR